MPSKGNSIVMEMNFCRRCGAAMISIEHHVYRCANDHTIFANASPTVGVFFVNQDGDIVLSRRGIEPYKGMLDTIGGFLNGSESLEQGLAREIFEETGLTPDDHEQPTYLCSITATYEYGSERLPIISTLFYAKLHPGAPITPNDDITEVVSRSLHTISFDEIGNNDIKQGIKILQQHLK